MRSLPLRLLAAALAPIPPLLVLAVLASAGSRHVLRPYDLTLSVLAVDAVVFPFVFSSLALYLRSRTAREPSIPRTWALLLIVLAVVVAVVGSRTAAAFSEAAEDAQIARSYTGPRTFSKAAWRENAGARWYMADELVETGRLRGLTRREVESLLGSPEEDDPYFEGAEMVYWLGRERGLFAIDYEWLVIEVEDSGLVESYSVMSD